MGTPPSYALDQVDPPRIAIGTSPPYATGGATLSTNGTAIITAEQRISDLERTRLLDAARIATLETQVSALIKVLRGVAPDRLAVAGIG